MEFENLSFEQKVAVHELEIGALRNELQAMTRCSRLIDLLAKPGGSADFAHDLKKLLPARRDALRAQACRSARES